jgi:hypothetical protein
VRCSSIVDIRVNGHVPFEYGPNLGLSVRVGLVGECMETIENPVSRIPNSDRTYSTHAARISSAATNTVQIVNGYRSYVGLLEVLPRSQYTIRAIEAGTILADC